MPRINSRPASREPEPGGDKAPADGAAEARPAGHQLIFAFDILLITGLQPTKFQ